MKNQEEIKQFLNLELFSDSNILKVQTTSLSQADLSGIKIWFYLIKQVPVTQPSNNEDRLRPKILSYEGEKLTSGIGPTSLEVSLDVNEVNLWTVAFQSV